MRAKNSFGVRVYDLPLNRFANIALPQFLQQIKQHEDNLIKLKDNQDLKKLRLELIKGNQSVSQLEAALQELEEVSEKLTDKEKKEFEDSLKPFKIQALTAIKNFKKFSVEISSKGPSCPKEENGETTQPQLLQSQIFPEEIELEERKAQLDNFETLQRDIEELHDLFSEFSQQVHSQGNTVSNIENNVETALVHVQEGQTHLAKAAKLKTALYPITGALIGTCIGGPVGLLAGLKIGSLAAVGGTVLGFAGGKGLKEWQERAVNNSVDMLTKSQSTPNDLKEVASGIALPLSKSFCHPSNTTTSTENLDHLDRKEK